LAEQQDTLCEMNVIEQVGNVAKANVLQDAWSRGQNVTVHGWCYGLKDGLSRTCGVTMRQRNELVGVFRNAIKRYPRGTPL
jgi:carbonic anhydrase